MPNRISIQRGNLLMPIYITEIVSPRYQYYVRNKFKSQFLLKPKFIQFDLFWSSAMQYSDFSKYLTAIKKMNCSRKMRGLPNQKNLIFKNDNNNFD